MQEWIQGHVQWVQHLAPAGFGNASQQVEIRLRRVELRRVIDARADDLRAAHLPVFDIHQVQQVGADLFSGEPRFIMPRPGLFKAHRLALAFGTGDHSLQVQEVPEVALFVESLDVDQPIAPVGDDLGREVRILQAPHAPLPDLGPKLPVFVPVQPDAGPAGFGVGGEGHRATQAVLPMGQQRVAFIRPQGDFGARLGRRGDIAEQFWILRGADAAHQFAGGSKLRLEGVFVDRGLQDDGGLLDEDLGKLVRGVDIVETAFALLGHPDHRILRGVAGNENGAHGDAVTDNGLH